jgi:hypothetical protein
MGGDSTFDRVTASKVVSGDTNAGSLKELNFDLTKKTEFGAKTFQGADKSISSHSGKRVTFDEKSRSDIGQQMILKKQQNKDFVTFEPNSTESLRDGLAASAQNIMSDKMMQLREALGVLQAQNQQIEHSISNSMTCENP